MGQLTKDKPKMSNSPWVTRPPPTLGLNIDRCISPKKNTGGNPSHLSQGDLQYIEFLKQQRPSITYDEIIQQLYEFGDLPYGTISKTALSEAVRHRLPSGKEYSFKKNNIVAQERFTLQNMAYTQVFIDYLNSKDPYTCTCLHTLRTSIQQSMCLAKCVP